MACYDSIFLRMILGGFDVGWCVKRTGWISWSLAVACWLFACPAYLSLPFVHRQFSYGILASLRGIFPVISWEEGVEKFWFDVLLALSLITIYLNGLFM